MVNKYVINTLLKMRDFHSDTIEQGVKLNSWRAGALQSLAPTCFDTPAGMFLVCLVRA